MAVYEQLDDYMRAGYIPQCHVNRAGAVVWVAQEYSTKAQFAKDECHIQVYIEVMPEVYAWIDSDYVWEEGTLFKIRRR